MLGPVLALLLFTQSETVTVSVTNVDVFVSENGQRVHGLTKDDFEVFENGQKREITNFSEVREGSTRDTRVAPQSRRVLIYVDNASLNHDNRRAFIAAAREFLANRTGPGDSFAIVTATQSLTVRLPWTTDRAAVDAKLGEVGLDTLVGARDVDRRSIENRLQDVLSRERNSTFGSAPQGTLFSFETLMETVRQYAAREYNASRATLMTVNAAFNLFPPSAGRKMFLLVGEGVPMRPAMGLWRMLDQIKSEVQLSGKLSGLKGKADTSQPLNDATEFDLAPDLQKFTAAAARRGVVVYALNPGTNESVAGTADNRRARDSSLDFENMASNALAYQLLARDTGGLAFTGTKPSLALEEIAKDSESWYSIGFRSETARNIVVKSRKGHVRTVVAAAPVSRDDVMRDAVLAHHVLAPQSNDLRVALAADASVGVDGGRRRVPLRVMIPVDSLRLEKDGGEVTGGFNIYIAAGDSRGNAAAVNKQTHQIRWPADAPAKLAGRSVTYAVEVLLDPGADQISVGVLDQRSERTGFERITLK